MGLSKEAEDELIEKVRAKKSVYAWGSPWSDKDLEVFKIVLRRRFSDESKREAGVAYIDRSVDRQLNKARGLLTFNSLLVATLNIVTTVAVVKVVGSLFALTSCLVLLSMTYVKWGSLESYENTTADLDDGVEVVSHRAKLLTLSVGLSLVSVVILGFGLISENFASKPPPKQPPPHMAAPSASR